MHILFYYMVLFTFNKDKTLNTTLKRLEFIHQAVDACHFHILNKIQTLFW